MTINIWRLKIITTSSELTKEFHRLMLSYNDYFWVVAWADYGFEISNLLVKNKQKIKRLCVGLSFFGTDPGFLQQFYKHPGVRFSNQSIGTFHPKFYLFQNNEREWELLIGSGNFTAAAFSNNIEASILLSSKDDIVGDVYNDALRFINATWKSGKVVDEAFVTDYVNKMKDIKIDMPKLPSKGIKQPMFEKEWGTYVDDLIEVGYEDRIKFLNWVKRHLKKKQFHELDIKTRQSIAGFGSGEVETHGLDIGCFGTTRARGQFMSVVNKRPEMISAALKKIPSTGSVTKTDYQSFLQIFKNVSSNKELACATRMLCLWRPDYFINFNNKNKIALCEELKIKGNQVRYDSYWDLIIQPFINSDWTTQANKIGKVEQEIYKNRVALLDCLYYNWQ